MRTFAEVLKDCIEEGVGMPPVEAEDPTPKWVRKTLCEELGVNPSTLRAWENGVRPKDSNFIDLRRMLTPQPQAPDRHRELYEELVTCFLAGPLDPEEPTITTKAIATQGKHTQFVKTAASLMAVFAVAAVVLWMNWRSKPDDILAIDPEGPSIAVLPFDGMTDDIEQKYIALGMAEDIITDLSKLRGLSVIARNSSFSYIDKPNIDVREIGRNLGVKAVLEGSVRRIGDQVRINAQLIDTADGMHIWADRYDVPFKEISTVQDQITDNILTELDVALTEGEQAREWRRSTLDPKAYDVFLRARERLVASLSEEAVRSAIALSDEALALDPDFTAALSIKAWGYFNLYKYLDGTKEPLEKAKAVAQRIIELDPSFGEAYTVLAEIEFLLGDVERAYAASAKSVEVSPSNAKVLAFRTYFLADGGQIDEAVATIDRAMRLNPYPPGWYYAALGYTYMIGGRYDEAIAPLRRCTERLPDFLSCHLYLVVNSMETGRVKEAQASAHEVMRLNPEFSIDAHSYWVKSTDKPDEKNRRIQVLMEAGLGR